MTITQSKEKRKTSCLPSKMAIFCKLAMAKTQFVPPNRGPCFSSFRKHLFQKSSTSSSPSSSLLLPLSSSPAMKQQHNTTPAQLKVSSSTFAAATFQPSKKFSNKIFFCCCSIPSQKKFPSRSPLGHVGRSTENQNTCCPSLVSFLLFMPGDAAAPSDYN